MILTAMTFLTINILSRIEVSYAGAASDIRVLNGINRVRMILADTQVAADNYALTGSEESRTLYQSLWKDVDGLIAVLQTDVSDTLMAEKFRNIRGYYFEWVTNIGDKKMLLGENRAGNPNFEKDFVALSRAESEGRYFENAISLLRDLRGQLASSQGQSIEAARILSSTIGNFIGLVNILIAVFAIALGFVLTRSITNPVRLLKEGTQKIMTGKFEEIELHRTDELGQLAADFNKMSSMLGNNYTRLNAYSELVTALNSHVDIQDVEINSLNLICHHAGANIGALYLINKKNDLLELSAGYALRKDALSHHYALGEGIPGQCAKELRTLEISDLPTESGFMIDTGLVEVAPRYTLAVPVLFQERLLGVLVLGSMNPFDDLKKEIISNSVPQIGVALTNANNNEAAMILSREIALKNEELNKKNAELEKAYRVKSDFLASMSHELRTPLNSIIGFSSVLLGPTGDPLTEDQRMATEKVLKNGKHLLQLINDILDFSKLESGRMTVNVESDDVANIVSNTVMTIEMLVKQKGLVLRLEIDPDLPMMKTDILKIKQIIVNLLSNAVKFTEHGEVVLSVRQPKKGTLMFAVRDSGIGIEEKNLSLVFEEFQQIDNSHSRKYKGTGLGLPISRRLARMLGGDLSVESVFGKGSTFVLTVPVEFTPDMSSEQPAPMPLRSIAARKSEPQPLKQAIAQTIGPESGTKILCIDDDPDALQILRSYLVPEGYSVTVALSGDEGIKLAKEIKPALITLDIMMPQKDGWQVLRELKRDPDAKDIPVIIHSMIDNKPLAMSLGAIAVMPKPVDSRQLLERVQMAVKTSDEYVLVVDDNKEYAEALKREIENEGFKSTVATNGEEALEILKKSKPALIFLDVVMPGMDGFQVVKRLQANEAWKKIPVIIMSGKELTDRERDMLQAYITDVMNKSEFSKEAISSTIKRVLATA
jgi:signal transduction histidine kinase/DNA-binding response OmpR family regulator/HAMP domain-containing protein